MLRLLNCLHYVQENRDELLVKVEDLKSRIVGSSDEWQVSMRLGFSAVYSLIGLFNLNAETVPAAPLMSTSVSRPCLMFPCSHSSEFWNLNAFTSRCSCFFQLALEDRCSASWIHSWFYVRLPSHVKIIGYKEKFFQVLICERVCSMMVTRVSVVLKVLHSTFHGSEYFRI